MPIEQQIKEFEALKTRQEALIQRGTRVQIELEAARRRHAELSKEALERFGTDDPAKLAAMLAKQEADNTAALALAVKAFNDYEEKLQKIEKLLAADNK